MLHQGLNVGPGQGLGTELESEQPSWGLQGPGLSPWSARCIGMDQQPKVCALDARSRQDPRSSAPLPSDEDPERGRSQQVRVGLGRSQEPASPVRH